MLSLSSAGDPLSAVLLGAGSPAAFLRSRLVELEQNFPELGDVLLHFKMGSLGVACGHGFDDRPVHIMRMVRLPVETGRGDMERGEFEGGSYYTFEIGIPG